MGWYFHNYIEDMDAEKIAIGSGGVKATKNTAWSEAESMFFVKPSVRRLFIPSDHWKAFNPSDNRRVGLAAAQKEASPVAVGHERLLYEVSGGLLKHVYFCEPVLGYVHHANWVFASSMTPVQPGLSQHIDALIRRLQPWDTFYTNQLRDAIDSYDVWIALTSKFSMFVNDREIKLVLALSPCAGAEDVQVNIFSEYRGSMHSKLAEQLLSHQKPSGAVDAVCRFSWDAWKVLSNLPDRASDDELYEPPPLTNVLFVFHGIGQKLADRLDMMNFNYAIDTLWALMNDYLKVAKSKGEVGTETKYLILPVNWRRLVKFSDLPSYSVEDIMMPKMSSLRGGLYDVLLDIPLYMSQHKDEILTTAVAEANRLYDIVELNHPRFNAQGRIDVVGHSLGSIIAADILAQQPTSCASASRLLKFDTTALFTVGSPLGFFLYLRSKQLSARRFVDPGHAKQSKSTNGSSSFTSPLINPLSMVMNMESYAVKSLYNIAHELDLVASRLNPTVPGEQLDISTAYVGGNEPEKLGICVRAVLTVKNWVGKGKETNNFKLLEVSKREILHELNDNGQLDWVIPSTTFANQIIGLLTAHLAYWANAPFARFLVIETGRYQGAANARPEFMARMRTGSP